MPEDFQPKNATACAAEAVRKVCLCTVRDLTPVTAYAEDFHIVSGAAGGAHAPTHYDMDFYPWKNMHELNTIRPWMYCMLGV